MKTPVTFLGPLGATFSGDAYDIGARLFGAPIGNAADYRSVQRNEDIIPAIVHRGGFGAIAMQTRAEGRIDAPLGSFMKLLKTQDNSTCPVQVIGAIEMPLHFCLMARPGVSSQTIVGVVAHGRALGACVKRVKGLKIKRLSEVDSNGEAARLVAEVPEYAEWAALGPRSAADKFGLQAVDSEFEDAPAATMFFMLGPRSHVVSTGDLNRALIVCELSHAPGALVDALIPFKENGLNLIQIHSLYVTQGRYDFAIEVELGRDQISSFQEAVMMFEGVVKKHITFGPFPVL